MQTSRVEYAGRVEHVGHSLMSTTDFIDVSHYGVHWTEDGVAYLEQGGPKGGSNVIGLARRSPFRIRIDGRNRTCNHNIPLTSPVINPMHLAVFEQVATDSLVQSMATIPGGGAVYFSGDQLRLYLLLLSRMSSPLKPPLVPLWSISFRGLQFELMMTNVQPLVVTDIEPKDTETIRKLAQVAVLAPRRLVLLGRPEVVLPPEVVRQQTEITKHDLGDLIALPWESYGAARLKNYMRMGE